MKKVNDGHYFEAMDRASIMCDMFERTIIKHPAVWNDNKTKKHAKKIMGDLAKLYQMCGANYSQREELKRYIDDL